MATWGQSVHDVDGIVTSSIDGGVATLSFRDSASRNALNRRTVPLLEAALDTLGSDQSVKVIVLEGLPDVFCSGGSSDVLRELAAGHYSLVDFLLPKRILDLPVPVVAAMAGHAIGAGFALGACADIVLLARESRYGLSFMNMGFTPGMGTTRLFEHVLSTAVAHELLYTGEHVRGGHFADRSGFNYILPREDVVPKARDLAARIAEKPRLSLELLKRTLSLPKRTAFEATTTIEALMHRVTLTRPETARAIEDVLSRTAAATGS